MFSLKRLAALVAIGSFLLPNSITYAQEQQVLKIVETGSEIKLDGDASDWSSIDGISIPLRGRGKVDSVEMKAASDGTNIYFLAIWADNGANELHKPYKWDEVTQSYKGTRIKEDRFALSLKMSGTFSNNKIGGDEFEADVWHWKASRSNKAGVAHDKWWKISKEPFDKGTEWETDSGQKVYLARISDTGSRLYKSTKYDTKQEDEMPRYILNLSPEGSIADIKAKGAWSDGKWVLEMKRALNTGNADDAAIPEGGQIEAAIAAFNGVDSEKHSVSGVFIIDNK